ncbi:MAG: Regulatory protein RecX [Candidatus Woesebacteria bacterium GW2011_GWB1_43_14]|uniref:Regulatory protein RecX n=1 Tax=Candidatus Woesebacteria bacterium GW2011_GWB1_43_14 TaxID=1618578 RepID=A0A0G1DI66_9BACT|nr:MAG: Regulatory protein RecX [Candidatus Woesebacteria bacterium GW2011_GWA1_39_11b]KKS78051.1 MAG: Regulatory protein RecX [Candidatus Woesebacteria bacterium GW2011_GWC1_42_9]KKS97369.1 MAG: Regulatory protein RecX [Candidatus Woesebacteria bacterium GW2011_GWB1_43_14]
MPTITSIKKQKSFNRVNVYLDGKFGFGIDLDSFVKLNLRVEQELTEAEVGQVVKKAEFQKTYEKILKYSTLRPRSKKELTDWLKRKKIHRSIYTKLFNRLKRLELIDDYKFAQWWVSQRIQFRGKSTLEITQELHQKGIDRNIIKKILGKSNINEDKIIVKLINKNKWRWSKYDKDLRKKKMRDYLMRRGFRWDAVKKFI